MRNTSIINFVGQPSAGKSTLSHGLMYRMKMDLMSVEHVSEFAKDLTWENNMQALSNQIYVTGSQAQRLERIVGKVDYIITDSPLLLSVFYTPERYPEAFKATVIELFKQYDNMNYFVKRVKPYNPDGRNQTAKEADKLADTIYSALSFYKIPFTEITGDEAGLAKVYKDVLKRKK